MDTAIASPPSRRQITPTAMKSFVSTPVAAASASAGPTRASRARKASLLAAVACLSCGAIVPAPARAVDGCLVLLCLAAPSWQNIAQCVDPVRQVLSDLAHGRPFPSCPMAGATNSASNQWSNAPALCPPQYTRSYELDSGTVYTCDYDGVVTVDIDGAPWSRTWWSVSGGGTVTDFSPAAKAQLGTWDPKFDDDYAAWLASLPPASPCTTC